MTAPKNGNRPMSCEETPGKKAYCQCGLSAKLPYCDGAHSRENTGISPIVVEVAEPGKKWICQCRQSGDLPWCDGAHKQLCPPQASGS